MEFSDIYAYFLLAVVTFIMIGTTIDFKHSKQ
jgi:hypothetical protein